MTPALKAAADRDKARDVLKAAMANDLGALRDLLDSGAECGMDRADVDDLALLMDGANTQMFAMLNLHEPGKVLNAPLYFAAFRDNEVIVNYLLNNTPWCQDSLNAALYAAAANGSTYIATRLIDLGADAACAEGACIEAAIAKGHTETAEALMAAGKSYTAALAAYIDRGETDRVIELLADGAEPLAALKAVCRQLSDYSAARDYRKDGEYKDAFDIIVSYATGFGADISQLLQDTMAYAIDRGAGPAIDKIISHPDYAKASDRQSQIDAALSFVATSSFRGFNPSTYTQYEDLAGRLMDMGADPQVGLEQGAPAGSVPVVEAALSRGADPRRHGRESIRRAFTDAVQKLVQAAEQKFDRADYVALEELSAEGLDIERLRAIDPVTGRSGLMIAAAAGEMNKALAVYEKTGEALTVSELLAQDSGGDSALGLSCDRGQAGMLLRSNLWLLRESDYLGIFEKMPESTRAELGERHAEVLNGLKAHRDAVLLRQQAEEHRKRFRPK